MSGLFPGFYGNFKFDVATLIFLNPEYMKFLKTSLILCYAVPSSKAYACDIHLTFFHTFNVSCKFSEPWNVKFI